MRTIGLIGGMSWESSAHYYRIINEAVRDRPGGARSADLVMVSLDFQRVEVLQHAGAWTELGVLMIDAARRLERAGAEAVLICSNTMHLVADKVAAAITAPLIHIADPTAAAIKAAGLRRVGLLGTAFTMEKDFYRRRLEARFGLEVMIPAPDERRLVHEIIYSELILGRTLEPSRSAYRQVIQRLVDNGAEAVILGCTEIMLLIGAGDSPVPIFDTTRLHALAAVDAALAAPIGTVYAVETKADAAPAAHAVQPN